MLPVRVARDGDLAFVLDAWKKSYEGAAAVKLCDRDFYRVEMERVIKKLFGRDGVTTLMAHDPSDDDHVVGFACFTVHNEKRAELHYVYVKKDFRGKGIARKLLERVPIESYTFLSPTARPRKGWRFTPRFTI